MSRATLSEYQQEVLNTFQEITQITDDTLAIDMLANNGWNLEGSVNNFMSGGQSSATISNLPSSSRRNPIERRNTSHSDDIQPIPENFSLQNSGTSTPSSSGNATSSNNSSSQLVVQGGLLDLLLTPLKWLFSSRSLSLQPGRSCEALIEDLNSIYQSSSTNHRPSLLPFYRGSYERAVSTAWERSSFLLVYLHSPLHEDSEFFVNNVLCHTDTFSRLFSMTFQEGQNSNESINSSSGGGVVLWGGRIWDAEPYALSAQLSVSAFPFVAVLLPQSARTVQIVDKIEGSIDRAAILSRLENSMGVFRATLERNRQESQRRAEAIRLREQQDREYQEALDNERRESERVRAEEEKRILEERLAREAAERAAAQEAEAKRGREKEITIIKEYFATHPEPAEEKANGNNGVVTTIRFQLPRGKKLSRRFLKTDTAQVISDYLKLHFFDEGEITKNFSMSTTFPKMEINELNKTIEALGLHPRAMLYVQDVDA